MGSRCDSPPEKFSCCNSVTSVVLSVSGASVPVSVPTAASARPHSGMKGLIWRSGEGGQLEADVPGTGDRA